MRYVFFTFRPHPADLQKFDDFLTLFIHFIKSHESYAYTVEKDGTPARHVHALLGDKSYRDMDKFKTKYGGKKRGLKQYEDMILKGKQTNAHGFDTKLIPDDKLELLKTLGYINKETSTRADTTFDDATITEAIKAYHAHARLDASVPQDFEDTKIITIKNIYSYMQLFFKNHKDKYDLQGYTDHKFIPAFVKEGHGLCGITTKQLNIARRECQLRFIDTDEIFDQVGHEAINDKEIYQYNHPNEDNESYDKTVITYDNQALLTKEFSHSDGKELKQEVETKNVPVKICEFTKKARHPLYNEEYLINT